MIINFIIKLINRPPHLLRRWNYNDSYVCVYLCVCLYIYSFIIFARLVVNIKMRRRHQRVFFTILKLFEIFQKCDDEFTMQR